MNQRPGFIPAFHFHWLTRYYDPMMRWLFPESGIKAALIAQPALIVQSIAQSIAFLEAELKRLQQAIDDHIDRHPGLKRDMVLLDQYSGSR